LNPYDPQFRGASDLYNQSLEGMLRLVRDEGELRPGMSRTVTTANTTCSFDVAMHSTGWHAEDIERLEFVSDFQIQGLQNHYHTYGLGVPLIALRRGHEGADLAEKYYPPDVCFPLTAFLRVETAADAVGQTSLSANHPRRAGMSAPRAAPDVADPTSPRFVLELYDPLDRQSIEVA